MHSPSVNILILEMKIVHDEDACCGDFRGSGPSGPIELPSYSNCIQLFFFDFIVCLCCFSVTQTADIGDAIFGAWSGLIYVLRKAR